MSALRLTRDGATASFMGKVLPPGPWHAEPDHEEFRSPEGLACIVHRNGLGSWCGYVGVPPGHPWHGKGYDNVDAEVHGGLTYAERCQGPICHVPRPGESDDVWWLGFDCNHSQDLSMYEIAAGETEALMPDWSRSYKTVEYVRAKTLALATQAAAAAAAAAVSPMKAEIEAIRAAVLATLSRLEGVDRIEVVASHVAAGYTTVHLHASTDERMRELAAELDLSAAEWLSNGEHAWLRAGSASDGGVVVYGPMHAVLPADRQVTP